ncbi:hypothetical protein Tco_0056920, partial [Tanacetum coccineum]
NFHIQEFAKTNPNDHNETDGSNKVEENEMQIDEEDDVNGEDNNGDNASSDEGNFNGRSGENYSPAMDSGSQNKKEKERSSYSGETKGGEEGPSVDSKMGQEDGLEVSPSSSVGSGGDRLRKKRKSYGVDIFEGEEIVKTFNQGKGVRIRLIPVGRRSVTKDMEAARQGCKIDGCNLNLDQVKEVGELIGVSWNLAEGETKSGGLVREGNMEENAAAGQPQ